MSNGCFTMTTGAGELRSFQFLGFAVVFLVPSIALAAPRLKL